MFSYIESRGGDYDYTVFAGLQYILKEYLTYRVTAEDVNRANALYTLHGEPFNYEGWMYIVNNLNGKLPLRIRAVPEGTVVPGHNILVSIESTDPKVFWVASWMETMLLRVWYPITVATRSHKIKSIIHKALEKSSDDPDVEIMFKLHDFGSRGVSSQESAMLGGLSHLINFRGSDTIAGIICGIDYYHCDMAGFSIPAAEHSSITSWGKENEVEAYRNMIKQFAKPGALVAVVSDSYDLYNACEKLWGDLLKQEVIDSGAIVVIRPDSGHPPTVVLKTAEILASKFGHTVNSKGYKVINNVRIIQGDGVNEHSIKEILDNLMGAGFSATNVGFGMGGQLLQGLNRDTLKFAMKCSDVIVNGNHRDVFKDPVTDHGKKSKAGRLDLVRIKDGSYKTIKLPPGAVSWGNSVMRTIYENGEILVDDSLDTIRSRVT
jgi:nicotinamide phosphoribosyltransferase